jgi:crotonobetainyl-CoA hydratase
MELLLTGEPIDAGTALELHLVNKVVPAADVLAVALALAQTIAANAPLSVRAHKRIALGLDENSQSNADASGWAMTYEEIARTSGSEDAIEGPRAFAEKRAAQWTGR